MKILSDIRNLLIWFKYLENGTNNLLVILDH